MDIPDRVRDFSKAEAMLNAAASLSEYERTPELPTGRTITQLVALAHKNAVKKGWHEAKASFGDCIALTHAELSEALEHYRNGRAPEHVFHEGGKPDGIPIELADAVIRIFDMCGFYGIDLESAILEKMAFNETRPHRHGGKKI